MAFDEEKHTGPGRPKLFDSPESFEKACDEYIAANSPLLTITGLAMYLGFESRQSFYDYEKMPEYSYIVKKARLAVENSYELSLRTVSVTGAIFALKNMGWRDRSEIAPVTPDGEALGQPVINIQVVAPKLPDSEGDVV